MKNFIKVFLVIAAVVTMFSFASVRNTEAKSLNSVSVETKSDFLNLIKVTESDGREYIYIYTEGGIFITKVEEL
ncbi:MAG: hypothetical protein JSS91_05655 [Bacteroidetes bacterium]|nr:hypothetical protein [Bacteroidota bacterium]